MHSPHDQRITRIAKAMKSYAKSLEDLGDADELWFRITLAYQDVFARTNIIDTPLLGEKLDTANEHLQKIEDTLEEISNGPPFDRRRVAWKVGVPELEG